MNKEFLKFICEGDEILISNHSDPIVKDRVIKITPTRQIKTQRGYIFKNGEQKYKNIWDRNLYILENTKENIYKYELQENINLLYKLFKNNEIRKLNNDKILKILSIITED